MPASLRRRIGRLGLPLVVVIPTLLAIAYYSFIASDVYTSESRFVVRSPDRPPSAASLSNLLQGAGFSKATDEGHAVRDYILSRDALRVLDQKIALKKAYSRPDVDVLSRFAGIDPDDSFEALHRYYQDMVTVENDTASSIVTVTVKAFSAQDAHNANRLLLEQSEELVNRLNERARRDLLRYAESEVTLAEAKARRAASAMSRYRTSQSVVDPERQASVQLQQVAKMQDELVASKTQLSQLQTFTPSNSQIPVLRNRIKTLEHEVATELSRVTGASSSLTKKAPEFQHLALEGEFANKQLASALASLESARNEAQRKQVYLERIAQPSVPDVAQEPRRVRNVIASVIIAMVAWGLLAMLVAGVREHQD